jgi:hypothetical protein
MDDIGNDLCPPHDVEAVGIGLWVELTAVHGDQIVARVDHKEVQVCCLEDTAIIEVVEICLIECFRLKFPVHRHCEEDVVECQEPVHRAEHHSCVQGDTAVMERLLGVVIRVGDADPACVIIWVIVEL